jgi:hypothetical protein
MDQSTMERKKAGVTMKRSSLFGFLFMWVLWTRTQGPASSEDWVGSAGFKDEAQCTANMKEKLDIWRKFKDAKFTGNSVTFTESKATTTYICLPDSEDPRKGKMPKKEK